MILATVTAFGSGRSHHSSNSSVTIASPSTLPSGVVSTFYSDSLTATGGTTPYTWEVKSCSGACNTGLGLTSSGIMSGMPGNAGTSTFAIAVTDARGVNASASMNLTIATATASPAPTAPTAPTALAITSPGTLPGGVVSTSYSTSLAATGGTTPYTWAMKGCSGVCNAGLSLSPAGVFSGTPANSGSSTYSVGATDATGQTASASLNLTITAATSSTGATYFVSPSGSNSNPCTQASPCATPDYAVNHKAGAGDTVQVAAGTYDYGNQSAQFGQSGAAGKYITVTCATRGACKIQNNVTGNQTVVEIGSNYFMFDGFEVTNTSAAGNNLGLYVTSSFVNITRNKIHHIETDCSDTGGGGIQTTNGTHDITVDSNLIYDISWPDGGSPKCPSTTVQEDGILTETAGANIVITNNIVYHVSGGWGIGPGGSPGQPTAPIIISNNLVFSNSNGGIVITYTGDYSTVTNNIVLDNGVVRGQCGINTSIDGYPDSHILEANNDVYGNAGGDYCSAGTPIRQNNISVDPALGTTFANWKADGSGDYHQKTGSPTIDAGNSTAGPPPTVDFDGNPRPQGAGYDIGAYEYPN
jgi:pectate disaccharide-lyase